MATLRRALLWLNDRKALTLLLIVVFLSRIPFLGAGYGLHWDAWGNAKVARQIAETGHYTMARVPGAPVYELTIACLSWGGPWMLNGLSALGAVSCVGIFALLLRKYGCRDWLLAAAALGFSSVMYVSSVTAKDFTVACALVLLSALFVGKNRPVVAGIALGLAIGCRVTSGAMVLPLALVLFHTAPREQRVRQLVWLTMTSASVALFVFIPAFARYGFSFLTFFEPIYYPRWDVVAYRGTVEVWSALGCIGVAIAALGALALRRERTSIGHLPTKDVLAWSAAILIYAALYAAFPDQAAYFLPAVPFTILVFARFSPRWMFQTFCAMTIAGAFVSWENGAPAAGAVIHDRSERLQTMANVRNFYAYARTIPGRNVFVIGGFYHGIVLIAPESQTGHFVYLLTAKELADYIRDGFAIYYLPAIRQFEYDVHGIDLKKHGGIDVYEFYQSNQAAMRSRAGGYRQ
jgi:hypothetical protein